MIKSLIQLLQHPKSLLFVYLVIVVSHLPFMNEPPRSVHVWRQVTTMAMARNLAEEGLNPLQPKVDRRYDTNGITGSQFLSYEFGLGILYKVFGFNESLARWWSLLFYLLIAGGMYAFVFEITKNRMYAFAGGWMLAFSPELFYHGINALPDILALAAMLWSLVYLLRWQEARKSGNLWLFFGCITLAGLTKLQFLSAGICALVLFLRAVFKKELNPAQIAVWIFGGIISLASTAAWYIYARYLTKVSGLFEVGLVLNIEKDLDRVKTILFQNIVSDLPELLLGFGSAVFFLWGLFTFFKESYRHPYLFIFTSWSLLMLMFHYLVLAQMEVHQYYMLSYLPLLFFVAVFGYSRLYRIYRNVAVIVLMLAPIIAGLRIIPARWMPGKEGVLESFYDNETRAQISSLFKPEERIIAGPDVSGCINFYFTHTKGFGFNNGMEKLSDTTKNGQYRIEDYIKRGASKILITDTSYFSNPIIRPYMKRILYKNDELMVGELLDYNAISPSKTLTAGPDK